METSPDSLLLIAGLLLLAKVSGAVAIRFGMPSVLGILVAGLLAGPGALGLIGRDEFVGNLGHIGVVLLMFLAGLETDPQGLRTVGRTAFLVAIGGVALPMGAGCAVGVLAGMETMRALPRSDPDGDLGQHHRGDPEGAGPFRQPRGEHHHGSGNHR
ncbi:cation:proton antiporter [Candidatus Amarobacter glycogenicus]|uniref:cation:proton antiporter n=1 Tax=Candidatus Amarobacter glycogenicus TaxID=3140699 RepID=UPI002A178D37|nr:cation:proton antiporter [Dehalococcoidia bacterium]